MRTLEPKKLLKKLEELKNDAAFLPEYQDLKKAVIDWATEDGDEYLQGKFEDLLQHGCASGMVGGLIYYCDTHKFFDEYYNEIDALREDLEEQLGENIKIKYDMKNFYAWLAFEEIARMIYQEVNPEY